MLFVCWFFADFITSKKISVEKSLLRIRKRLKIQSLKHSWMFCIMWIISLRGKMKYKAVEYGFNMLIVGRKGVITYLRKEWSEKSCWDWNFSMHVNKWKFFFLGSLLLESKINPNTAYQKQQVNILFFFSFKCRFFIFSNTVFFLPAL